MDVQQRLAYSFLPVLLISDLWIWGITPPPAMVACREKPKVAYDGMPTKCNSMSKLVNGLTLIRLSSSSSPRMANCKCLGVIRLTCWCRIALFRCQQYGLLQRARQDHCKINSRARTACTAYLQVLGGVSSQLQNLCCQVLCGPNVTRSAGGGGAATASESNAQKRSCDEKLWLWV